MEIEASKARRGRPPKITRARIAEAGIEMGLPDLTFIGVAARLGVSHMALYKHVPNIEALRLLVAEEMFANWSMPTTVEESLEEYLLRFSASLQDLVRSCPGLAWYLVRQKATTPAMMSAIHAHHAAVATTYDITHDQARTLLSTVALYNIGLADTVYAVVREEAGDEGDHITALEGDFLMGVRALISGSLVLLGHQQPQ
jgi:AcrR family transcriptional regulator